MIWMLECNAMNFSAIQTRPMHPPQDDLFTVIKESITDIPEKSILAITSKVVAIHQGRCLPVTEVKDKDALVQQEADKFIPRSLVPHQWVTLSIKESALIPAAGIDESNSAGHYVLMPEKPDNFAQQMWHFLRREYSLKQVGVIITDSRTIPLRWGIVGISLGYYGFDPLIDYRGQLDIFGREIKLSMSNVVDSLAAAAVLSMGEGAETQPLVLCTQLDDVVFEEHQQHRAMLKVDSDEDLYAPLLKAAPWQKGNGGR